MVPGTAVEKTKEILYQILNQNFNDPRTTYQYPNLHH